MYRGILYLTFGKSVPHFRRKKIHSYFNQQLVVVDKFGIYSPRPFFGEQYLDRPACCSADCRAYWVDYGGAYLDLNVSMLKCERSSQRGGIYSIPVVQHVSTHYVSGFLLLRTQGLGRARYRERCMDLSLHTISSSGTPRAKL
jgi:hypothetical protein